MTTAQDGTGAGRDAREEERATRRATVQLVDVLERVLAKGIVILYEADAPVLGLCRIEPGGHAVVRSLETYGRTSERPAARTESSEALMTAVDEYLRRLPGGSITGTR